MAKGSVRKKGKKWYYRFYVEDASGNLVQKECVGTESKSETEKLLRQAMDDYEKKKFVAKAEISQSDSFWMCGQRGIKNRYAQQWYGGELPRNNPKYQETPIGRTETEKCNL